MADTKYQRIRQIFHAACDLSNSERENYLAQACGTDSTLRAEVQKLLDLDSDGRTDALHEHNVGIGMQLLGASGTRNESQQSQSSTHGRFIPGTVVAERFRIVSRLGEGGMGDVYWADDLRLGQSVALKFLPADISMHAALLENLRNEVRLTREISHPNICRIHDLQSDGDQYFLSMEYVDGEDLKSLLRRIGRLPNDKGMDVALQLSCGLAAAHDKGVLHRDLKPANIMIDGRGHLRIMDFGLARQSSQGPKDWSGTPAYMAPEQIRDGHTSVQSDLYALGLILYEIFTGKSPSASRLHDGSRPLPSSVASDMDPVVEQIITRCLEDDPNNRPTSAHSVAGAIPASGSLEAALAAGQIPSVEMVASLGEERHISRAMNTFCLCVIFVGIIAAALLSRASQSIIQFNPSDLHQLDAARAVARALGPSHAADATWGVEWDTRFFQYTDEQRASWKRLAGTSPSASRFWYRESNTPIVPDRGRQHFAAMFVTPDDPPLSQAGMSGLKIDANGTLLEWTCFPNPNEAKHWSTEDPWPRVLQVAKLDRSAFESEFSPVEDASSIPPVYADRWEVWRSASGLQLELAANKGQPVYMRFGAPRIDSQQELPPAFGFVLIVTVVAIFTVAIRLAWRNWRTGRADRRGAVRVFLFVVITSFLYWVLQAHHVLGPGEMVMAMETIARALLRATVITAAYVGLEPYARRQWPRTLVGWNRVLNGRVRDPIVGRDLLLGVMAGVAAQLAGSFWLAAGVPRQLSLAAAPVLDISSGPFPLRPLMGLQVAMGQVCRELTIGLVCGFVATLLFVYVLRAIFRSQWLSCVLFVLFFTAPSIVKQDYVAASTISIWTTIALLSLFRAGVLTVVVAWIAWQILSWPVTIDPTAPNIDIGLAAYLCVAAFAVYGFFTSRTTSANSRVPQDHTHQAFTLVQ